MVHQHFMLVPVLTVAENIVLGEETMASPVFLDRKEADRRIVELGRRFGFEIDPDAKVGSLSVGWQQRVEILKALYRDARILVLDEPTAVLTPQETEEIFEVLRRLAAEGHSIVFISHKLYEVLEIADRITVIRRGRVVGAADPDRDQRGGPRRADGRARGLARSSIAASRTRPRSRSRSRACASSDDRGHEVVHGVDLEVRAGEILGIAGVAGNGQDELVEAIVGLRKPTGGHGHARRPGHHRHSTSRDVYERGVALRPGRPPPLRAGAVVHDRRQPRPDRATTGRRTRAGILRNDDAIDATRPTSGSRSSTSGRRRPTSRPATLSGGNQQKVVVAREFDRDLRLLVLDQPTRGLDVGSIEFIHRQAIAKRDAGTAVLLVSAELDEVLELSDRIAVMYRGQLVGDASTGGRPTRTRSAC